MKILIIRFSSIGDILLTTPVIRCLKLQTDAEIHFLVKKNFAPVLQNNPYILKKHLFENWDEDLLHKLKAEKFDLIIDLHKNLRSRRFIWAIGVTSLSFDKINGEKWLKTALKIDVLPKLHIVDRYLNAISKLNVVNDGKGLDFFLNEIDEEELSSFFKAQNVQFKDKKYIAIAIGSAQQTKVPTLELYQNIIRKLDFPVILLGSKSEKAFGDKIMAGCKGKTIVNAAGALKLGASIACLKHAVLLISPDTGLMHAATAMDIPIVVIWGNTIPEFGMNPYYGAERINKSFNSEVLGLRCRPCSKIGYKTCPKRHFDCMKQQSVESIVENILKLIHKFEINKY